MQAQLLLTEQVWEVGHEQHSSGRAGAAEDFFFLRRLATGVATVEASLGVFVDSREDWEPAIISSMLGKSAW
jgi:hypothetical protein